MAEKTKLSMKDANIDKLAKLAKAKVQENVRVTVPWVKMALDQCGFIASESICTEVRNRLLSSPPAPVRMKASGNYGK